MGESNGCDRGFAIAAIVTLFCAIVPAVMWPGSASWMCDEPMIVGEACYYSMAHKIAERGLGGTFFIPYGPLPTQIYQVMLLFTHNVSLMVFMRALLCSATLAGSLLWLSRSIRITPWFAAAVVMAPYICWNERVLWDASFSIPIATLAVAAYASFLRKNSGVTLLITLAAATFVPLIHMQGLPLFFAMAGHALWRYSRQVWRNGIGVIIVLGLIVLLNYRYFSLFMEFLRPRLSSMFKDGYGGRRTFGNWCESLLGPFLGGRLLTGEHDVTPRIGMPGPAGWVEKAIFISRGILPLIWLGVAVCVVRQMRLFLQRRTGRAPTVERGPMRDAASVRDTMIGIGICVILLQMALAASLRVPPLPQYSFGTFPYIILFGWMGVEFLRRFWLGLPVLAIWGLATACLTFGGAWRIQRDGWPRGILSPPLADQIRIATQLNRYSDDAVWTDVYMCYRYPMALRTLRLLLPPESGVTQIPSPHGLLIRYVPGPDPTRSQIELIELQSDAQPPNAQTVDVTPEPLLY